MVDFVVTLGDCNTIIRLTLVLGKLGAWHR